MLGRGSSQQLIGNLYTGKKETFEEIWQDRRLQPEYTSGNVKVMISFPIEVLEESYSVMLSWRVRFYFFPF